MLKAAISLFLTVSVWLYAEDMISPLPQKVSVNDAKALLGKRLFSDVRLSKDNSVSCKNCHLLQSGGTDGQEVSFGVSGQKGTINSPTVFNARYNLAQFWDGHAKTLKDQVLGPLTNPVEMAMRMEDVVARVSADESYSKSFKMLYDDGVTMQNIADAIAEFEMALVTPNSRFDQFLRGDKQALSDKEREGYRLFKDLGCISCHNGINIGANMYQKFGIFVQYKGKYNNLGRFNVTKSEEDKYFFKVPTLRNIELTAPYFHDGSAVVLEEAVQKMALYQLGRQITSEEIEKIVAFLLTLTGETPVILEQDY